MGTHRVQMKRVLPWLLCWACRAGTRNFFPALAALVSPVQSIFYLAVHNISIHLPPSTSKLGRQPRRVACLLVCVSGLDVCSYPELEALGSIYSNKSGSFAIVTLVSSSR
jgi:hypothetical protein